MIRTVIKIHDLKCWPVYYKPVEEERKPFEVRKSDRDFQVGDILRLREWEPTTAKYLGSYMYKSITYILSDSAYLLPGYVILGLGYADLGDIRDACEREAKGNV